MEGTLWLLLLIAPSSSETRILQCVVGGREEEVGLGGVRAEGAPGGARPTKSGPAQNMSEEARPRSRMPVALGFKPGAGAC